MKYIRIAAMSFTSIFFALSVYASTNACAKFPYVQPQQGPFANINCDFHIQYEKRVAEMIKTFGALNGRPVILNLGGTLLLKYNGNTETVNINPSPYHEIKTFAHGAFAVYLALSHISPGSLSQETQTTLRGLQKDLERAKQAIPTLRLSADERAVTQELADTTETFLAQLLSKNSYSHGDLKHFYATSRPLMLKLAQMVTAIELHVLNNAVNGWMNKMPARDKEQIGVVVATAHQARAQEISLQYFAKKFNFTFSEGALSENNFVVIEDKFDEASALKLLARHYIDREAASEIFNDPVRLQRDLLSDGAQQVLKIFGNT